MMSPIRTGLETCHPEVAGIWLTLFLASVKHNITISRFTSLGQSSLKIYKEFQTETRVEDV